MSSKDSNNEMVRARTHRPFFLRASNKKTPGVGAHWRAPGAAKSRACG